MSLHRVLITLALFAMADPAYAGATLSSPVLGTAGAYELECFARNVGNKDVAVTIAFHQLVNDAVFGTPSTFTLAPGQGQFVSLNTAGVFYTCVVVVDGSKKAVRASWQLKDGTGVVLAAGDNR
jgi:hypothetical protein